MQTSLYNTAITKESGVVRIDKNEHLDALADFINETDRDIKSEADKLVQIEHCINIKELRDYKVSCSYGDMVFIICILKDYLKLIADKEGHIWDYYQERFAKLADKLAAQIGYDYEKQLEKCRKKLDAKETRQDDVGEDAMALAVNKGRK